MPVTYTNRKMKTYTLYSAPTKTGKLRYYFARESAKGTPCEAMPEGYEVLENPNGQVSIGKIQERLIHQEEIDTLQKIIDMHHRPNAYRLEVKGDRIVVHELEGYHDLAERIESGYLGFSSFKEMIREDFEKRGRYDAVMRFILESADKRVFVLERFCYRGSIDDWITVGVGKLDVLAEKWIKLLGTDDLYESIF